MKIKGTIDAWIASDGHMQDFMDGMRDNNQKVAVDALVYACADMSDSWVKAGVATITVELLPVDQLQHQQLAALRAQLEHERAQSMIRQNAIMDRISKLQALEFNGSAP